MTEQEWLTSTDPTVMLTTLREGVFDSARGVSRPLPATISDRKLRLFACACCRQVWHLLPDERSRRAVEVAERYADGEATEEELVRAWCSAQSITHGASNVAVAGSILTKTPPSYPNPWGRLFEDCGTPAAQVALLREVVGNPWRPVAIPCTKRAWAGDWLTPAVLALARAAYEEQAGDGSLDPLRLLVLADALEEAGCPLEERYQDDKGGQWPDFIRLNPTLAHLRSPGPHVRGCHVIDLTLGKA